MAVNRKVVAAFVGIVGFVSCVGINELVGARQRKIEKIASIHNISQELAMDYYNTGLPTSYLESKGRLEKLIANGGDPEVMKRIVDRNRGPDTRRRELSDRDLTLLENSDNNPKKRAENYQTWMESGYSLTSADIYLTYNFNLNEAVKLQGVNAFSVDVFELASRGVIKEFVYEGLIHGLSKKEIFYLAESEFDNTKTYSQEAMTALVEKGWKVYEIEYVARDLQVPYSKVQTMIGKGMKKEGILRKLGGK